MSDTDIDLKAYPSEEELQSLSFEEALQTLEEITRKVESGSLPLEETLVAFEAGVKLTQICRLKLDTAQGKIQKLMADGKLEAFAFNESGAS